MFLKFYCEICEYSTLTNPSSMRLISETVCIMTSEAWLFMFNFNAKYVYLRFSISIYKWAVLRPIFAIRFTL